LIDRRRLTELTEEVDQLHHESMRTIGDELGEAHLGEMAPGFRSNRRRFLTRMAAGGAVLTAGSMVAPIAGLVPAASAATSDLDLVRYMASIELALVEIYREASDTQKLRLHVADAAATFGGHHQDHADALNTLIGETGTVTDPNKKLQQQYKSQLQGAADEDAVLTILYGVEEAAASTYLASIGALTDSTDAGTLATILPVESQHATVLGSLLQKPATSYLIDFVTTDAALDIKDYPVPAAGDQQP
jgi:hypothetical protein